MGPLNPPFRSVAIVGLGLMGGSIALGLRRAWPAVAVIGVDRAEVLSAALQLGAITGARAAIDQLQDVDLIVLAAPVEDIIALIDAARGADLTALVTDVGSTKRQIMAAADRARLRFVGGHPIAGAATSGLANARADILQGREWLLVPGAGAETDVQALERMVRGLGAVPRRVAAETHDRVMAYVSHLPQLLSSALMWAAGGAVGDEGLAAAGPGFADMTRLAGSPPDIWRGILSTNADYVAEAVQAFLGVLPATGAALADRARIEQLFAEAKAWSSR